MSALIEKTSRGPSLAGSRLTVYDFLDYLLGGWTIDQIAAFFHISTDEVRAVIDYIDEHKLEVIREYLPMLERDARGNPPEFQAKIDANHEKFLQFVKEFRERKAQGSQPIS